jgi:hypothetical protein
VAFVEVLKDFGIEHKILSVTCDNASNNDTMATELEYMLTKFSPVNRTRCFAHILNLVAKSLLKQFDVKKDDKEDDLNDEERTLLAMAGDIEQEEMLSAQEQDDADGEVEDDDDLEGWVDEVEALTPGERENLNESIRPVKKMLVKVKKFWNVFNCMS